MAFATAADVATRLGRDLTTAEEGIAADVAQTVSGLIAGASGKDDDWIDELDPVPAYFRALCIEKAIGALSNPENLAAESKQLGSYQRSRTFQRSLDGGTLLSAHERREVRRLSGSASSATIPTRSVVDDLWPCEGS